MRMYVFEDLDGDKNAIWPDRVRHLMELECKPNFTAMLADDKEDWIDIEKPLSQVVKELEECRNPPPRLMVRTNEQGNQELVPIIDTKEWTTSCENIIIHAKGVKCEGDD